MNNKKLKFVAVFLTSLTSLISGCATVAPKSFYAADITVFHDSLPISPGTSIKILPWRDTQKDSLEFKNFSKILEDRLVSFGFIVLPENSDSKLVAFFDYGIDGGTNQVSSYSIPNFGVTGYSGGYTTGTISSFGTYRSQTTLTPQYGVTGYRTEVMSNVIYTRFINIDIAKPEGNNLKKLYEGRLLSKGSCSKLTVVLPNLMDMYFYQFPRQSGVTKSEQKQWDGSC